VDLQLYLRVLWRFRLLMAAGAALAILLALLSFARINPAGDGPLLEYREDEQWVSYATLFVTQEGFPWGQLTQPVGPAAKEDGTPSADPNRFSTLAVLYAQLATSDPVRKILAEGGPLNGEIDAAPVLASDNAFAGALPLVRIAAIADTPEHALSLVVRATDAFKRFLAEQQVRNKIADENRVLVTVLKRADEPRLFAGRSLTLPIVVFLSVMILFSAFAFILENFRPRRRPVAVEDEDAARLTA
jgi:hypothetical protein